MYKIRLAESTRDSTDLRRFWYGVYCIERGVLLDKGDHQLKLLDDPFIAESNIFVAEDSNGICGTVMTTYSRQVDIGEYASFYEMQRLPEHPPTTSITRKLMVSRGYRGSRLGIALACAAFDRAFIDGITHNFIDCNRPLQPFFQKLGFRNHSEWKIHPDFGEVRVMVLRLLKDQDYFLAIGSPFTRKGGWESCHVAV